ncbi:hypothetical protein LRP65_08120 [Nocardioides sp. cx-173]|nr:hypothetical protein [Nocardioides sp. cx-173]
MAFYPPTGFRDRRWIADDACDALVRSGRRVAEAYSEAVLGLSLTGYASEVRVFVGSAPEGQQSVSVEVHLDFSEGYESARALVPASLATLSAESRAEVALQILHGVMVAFAPHRGWSLDDLDRAAQQVRESGHEFLWHSAWKASPDRRREARGTFWLQDDAFGRAVIEVRERGVEGASVLRSPEAPAYCTSAGFVRSTKTLRWVGQELTMVPSIDSLEGRTTELRWTPRTASSDAPLGRTRAEGAPPESLPAVEITAEGWVPDRAEIRFIGGGPTNDVPGRYLNNLRHHLHRLEEDGLAWWSQANRNLLEITYSITDSARGVRVRRLHDRTTAVILRPLDSLGQPHPERLALEDACALVAAVSKRMDLEDPPEVGATSWKPAWG